ARYHHLLPPPSLSVAGAVICRSRLHAGGGLAATHVRTRAAGRCRARLPARARRGSDEVTRRAAMGSFLSEPSFLLLPASVVQVRKNTAVSESSDAILRSERFA